MVFHPGQSRAFLTVLTLMLAHAAAGLAQPADTSNRGAVRFEPAPAAPPQLQGLGRSVYLARVPQGHLYGATDATGKARLVLMRDNVVAADLTVPATQPKLGVDWPGSFAFSLGALPVVAISWKHGHDSYGIEELTFWAAQGTGRFLGGLPGSTRNPCGVGAENSSKDCTRCGSTTGIPIDVKLATLEPDRARFVQQRASTWFYYYGAAPETFEQDFVLSANGLAPEGQPRYARKALPVPQAKERVKGLLRDYFILAKRQSRPQIAAEFLTCFEQLAALAPDFGQAHYNVGCMNALLGNPKQAVASVVKAISLDPHYRKVARKDPDLMSVRDDAELKSALGESEE